MNLILKERSNGEWDYRFVADNGNLLVNSEGYSSKGNAKRAATNFLDDIQAFLLKGKEEYTEEYNDGEIKVVKELI